MTPRLPIAPVRGRLAFAVLAVFASLSAPLVTPGRALALDPGPWDQVLQEYAKGGGVDYAGLKADAEAMGKLDRFLEGVATMPAGSGLADWLNAYNALVVKAVVERYPISSVKRVPGFFDRITHRAAGEDRTLDAIENQVIRPRFEDPRVHFALNCAAKSCPGLRGRAFRQSNLDRVLDQRARRAVRNRTHVRRGDDGRWHVSALFFWFRDDFVEEAGSVSAWLRRHGGDALAELESDDQLVKRNYDWRLNDRS